MHEELRQTTHDIVEMRIRDTDTGLTGRDADDLANILADRIEQEITDIANSCHRVLPRLV